MVPNTPESTDDTAGLQSDVRQRIAAVLAERHASVTSDAVTIWPAGGAEALDPEYCARLAGLLVELLSFAVRDGRVDGRGGRIADLHRAVLARGVSMDRLFAFAYLVERAVLDELALDDSFGATSETWPVVAQIVRRASFDLLAGYAEHARLEPSGTALVDPVTTLYTRPLLDAVLAKEIERANRFGTALSLIVFDVDRLSEINREHGYGVGDRILERLGILIRQYFRHQDWVARHSDDSIAVLLMQTEGDKVEELAEQVRKTVEERLHFEDHRTDRVVRVTVSAAVVNVQVSVGDVLDPERLLADAEATVERAKRHGRNRVERLDVRGAR